MAGLLLTKPETPGAVAEDKPALSEGECEPEVSTQLQRGWPHPAVGSDGIAALAPSDTSRSFSGRSVTAQRTRRHRGGLCTRSRHRRASGSRWPRPIPATPATDRPRTVSDQRAGDHTCHLSAPDAGTNPDPAAKRDQPGRDLQPARTGHLRRCPRSAYTYGDEKACCQFCPVGAVAGRAIRIYANGRISRHVVRGGIGDGFWSMSATTMDLTLPASSCLRMDEISDRQARSQSRIETPVRILKRLSPQGGARTQCRDPARRHAMAHCRAVLRRWASAIRTFMVQTQSVDPRSRPHISGAGIHDPRTGRRRGLSFGARPRGSGFTGLKGQIS